MWRGIEDAGGISAVVRELKRRGYRNLLLRTHAELDLTDKGAVERYFEQERPEYVVLAAARVVEEFLPTILIRQTSSATLTSTFRTV